MKIRTGFVSNSSSSSFMIGVAKVTDHNKMHKWLKSLDFDKYDLTVSLYSALENDWGRVKKDGGYSVEAFDGSTVSIKPGSFVDTDTIFILEVTNNEGDGDFWVQDGKDSWDGYMNYDINLEHFDSNQQELYNGMCKHNGMELVDCTFGAGRNG